MKFVAYYIKVLPFLIAFMLFACQKEKNDETDNLVEHDKTAYILATGDLEQPNIAADNPLRVQGVKLGRMLFYEKKLSKDSQMSCASCHRQEHAFSDTSKFSIGVRNLPGKRQAMAIFNMAWNENEFFWDGRAHLLRDQALMPIQDSLEMDERLTNVINKLKADPEYKEQFIRSFGDAEITEHKISLALEQFMNSIVSVESKYDRYLRGSATLDSSEERGRQLFFAEFNPAFPSISGADCAHCHSGRNFENNRYMNNGLDSDNEMNDMGRMSVSKNASDKGKFKVPSLRNVELSPPYMHDGRFGTLEEVVEHYNSGMKNSSTIDPALIYPLNSGGLQLSEQDKKDLVSFLKSLTDEQMPINPEYSNPFN